MTKQNQIEKNLPLATIEQHARTLDAAMRQGATFKEIAAQFDHLKGETVLIPSAIVQKKITRGDYLKLFIKPNDSTLEVFAEFRDEAEKVNDLKIRKGSTVSLVGSLVSFGTTALNLTDCRLQESAK